MHDLPFASGRQALTRSEPRAIDLQSQSMYIPHEVKAAWAEGHVGQHSADLLQLTKESIARPAVQLRYYKVRHALL